MKLPDFSAFKPFDDNRQRMKARASQQSFVQVDSRLQASDLEAPKKERAHAPEDASGMAAGRIADWGALIKQPFGKHAEGSRAAMIWKWAGIVVVVQLVVLADAALVHWLYPEFGMPAEGIYRIVGRDRSLLVIEKKTVEKNPMERRAVEQNKPNPNPGRPRFPLPPR